MVPARGTRPPSPGSRSDDGPAPAGFEWAPLSPIAIDALDAQGSAVALDAILPPAQQTAGPSTPGEAQPATAPPRAHRRPSRKWKFALGAVLATVALGALVDPQAPWPASRAITSAVDRRLAALFAPLAAALVPGARTDIGTITATAVPWADVVVDGHWMGRTPIPNMRLGAGPHRLTFSHPDFGEIETIAVVRANEASYATVHFSPPD